MDLQRKKGFTPEYKKKDDQPQYKKCPPLDWTRYCIDGSAIIPHGKYQGYTVESVENSDEWYYNFMKQNDLFNCWGCYKERKQKKTTTRVNAFYSETYNEYWTCIEPFESGTDAAPEWWYE